VQISHLTDFSDKISPMLVKELRQGLRAKTFIGVFLSLQIFLGVMLLSAGASATSDRVGTTISAIIFTFFAVAVLIIQPLRGVTALSSEIKGNTIDMMVLTRLSAWRIIFGKWVALVSQSGLLLATIVPYLILRYFFGGMNLFAEIIFLGMMFLTSMGLTAITVGLSGSSSILIRGLLPVIGVPILMISLIGMIFGRGFQNMINLCMMDTMESRMTILIYTSFVTYIGGSALSLGASLISPAAENSSTIRRLVALVLLVVFSLVYYQTSYVGDEAPFYILLIIAPAIMIALTESVPLLPTVVAPFKRFGFLGKISGIFLYPGLPSGVFFSLLITAIATAAVVWNGSSTLDEEAVVAYLACIGGILLPAVIQRFAFKGEGQRFGNYLLLFIGAALLASIITALTAAMSNRELLWIFIWNPWVLMAMLDMNGFDDSDLVITSIVVNAIYFFILLLAAAKTFVREWKALDQVDSPDTPTP